jgi:hypothetical protein
MTVPFVVNVPDRLILEETRMERFTGGCCAATSDIVASGRPYRVGI